MTRELLYSGSTSSSSGPQGSYTFKLDVKSLLPEIYNKLVDENFVILTWTDTNISGGIHNNQGLPVSYSESTGQLTYSMYSPYSGHLYYTIYCFY